MKIIPDNFLVTTKTRNKRRFTTDQVEREERREKRCGKLILS